MLVLLLPLGLWVIVDALKTGYFLCIERRSGDRNKMTFQQSQNQDTLNELSKHLRSKLNYDIEVLSE